MKAQLPTGTSGLEQSLCVFHDNLQKFLSVFRGPNYLLLVMMLKDREYSLILIRTDIML